ncbi:hypothetical protein [uncultured Flavobacterium sp.]|uniref:hypothetical protein n=1 Tax=uncultured Flavobacterium sp. TaxID=165435 RepID=UPI0012128B74|nr:hypothetical protein [uncultured Flavobacterium sp.]THD31263.1 MAG: hypothetical protein DI588_12810 [Flavobacterium johnsoniae]
MSFKQSEMLYDDGKHYKWVAKADHDNPYYTGGKDRTELNRTEGYEVLYFINHIGGKHWNVVLGTTTYQKIEKMIRYSVPSPIRSHKGIADWIVSNWNNVNY